MAASYQDKAVAFPTVSGDIWAPTISGETWRIASLVAENHGSAPATISELHVLDSVASISLPIFTAADMPVIAAKSALVCNLRRQHFNFETGDKLTGYADTADLKLHIVYQRSTGSKFKRASGSFPTVDGDVWAPTITDGLMLQNLHVWNGGGSVETITELSLEKQDAIERRLFHNTSISSGELVLDTFNGEAVVMRNGVSDDKLTGYATSTDIKWRADYILDE